MAAEGNCHHRWTQVGRLALRPDFEGEEGLFANPVYTRFLTSSYKSQLLEINFTTNLNTEPELKEEIDHIMESVHLEE